MSDTSNTLVVSKATPTVVSVDPVNITYGEALANGQLSGTAQWTVGGATVNVPGTFAYTTAADTVLNAGNGQTEAVTFSATDSSDYNSAAATVTVTVAKATPTVVSVNPVDITYGTSLADGQLSGTIQWTVAGATVSVSGTFTYTSASGAVLNAGSGQAEAVTFSPTDSTDYNSTAAAVTVNVAKAMPTFGALSSPTIAYGTPTTTLSGQISLVPDGETVAVAVNGFVQSATVAHSAFTTSFTTSALGAAGSPYTITYAYAGDANLASVSDTSKTLTVTVPPALGTSALIEGPAAGTDSDIVQSAGPWTASANDSWLRTTSSGSGSGLATFTFGANPGTTRFGTLTIAGVTLTVTQAGSSYVAANPLTTLVSSGLSFPTGVAVDNSGNVYIVDNANNEVYEWSPGAGTLSSMFSATLLNGPTGVAVDGSGNVFIADSGHDAVWEWLAATRTLSPLGIPGLNDPRDVAVDGSGNVYIANSGNNAAEEWNSATHVVSTLVSSGLSCPDAVALDGLGDVFIADHYNNAVEEWNAATHVVSTLISSGLAWPSGVAVDNSGNVYVANTYNSTITEWKATTRTLSVIASAGLNCPYNMTVDQFGNVYIADTHDGAIKELPRAFVPATAISENAAAGSDALSAVLPGTVPLTGGFAPTCDQGWLTIGNVSGGVVNFSFTQNTSAARTAHITVLGQQITVTQAAAPSSSVNLGVYSNGYWYLTVNGSMKIVANPPGWAGATPLVGDWNGDGKSDIGIFLNGNWWLDTNEDGVFDSGDAQFTFGFGGGDVVPVVGDWSGAGKTEVGVYADGAWFRDVDGSHTWDALNQAAVAYLGWNDGGTHTVIPVPGQWAGTGKTEMGVYCQGVWFLDSTGSGQWDGGYTYWGWAGSLTPVVGNWSGASTKSLFGVYSQGAWFLDYDNSHLWDAANQAALAYYGWAGAQPVVGVWGSGFVGAARQAASGVQTLMSTAAQFQPAVSEAIAGGTGTLESAASDQPSGESGLATGIELQADTASAAAATTPPASIPRPWTRSTCRRSRKGRWPACRT